MNSTATTVEEYLEALPPERRQAIEALRALILQNLPQGFEEAMQYGMIGYHVSRDRWPQGYHCDPKEPLPFAGLASQKQHMAVYHMGVYGDPETEAWFRAAFQETGKKLDMGKSCIRFKKIQDLPLDVVAELFRRISVESYLTRYQQSLLRPRGARP